MGFQVVGFLVVGFQVVGLTGYEGELFSMLCYA